MEDYSNQVLDFDDASNFLSMLLSTVPSLDRDKWEVPAPEGLLSDAHKLLFDNFDQLSAEFMARSATDMANDLASDLMNPQQQQFQLYAQDFAPRMLSLSLESYSDLIGSHFGVSTNGTPNTSVSLPHVLPAANIKKELALPYYPDLFSTAALANASSAELEIESADTAEPVEQDVLSPKLKVLTKAKVTKPTKKTNVSHNMIEKKYRTNINSKILELRDAVPTLRIATGKTNVLVADLEGLLPASKLNKASVLTKATEYIKHLERKNEVMLQQITRLQSLIQDANMNPAPQMRAPPPQSNDNSGFALNSQTFDGSNDFMFTSMPMSNRPSQLNNMNTNMMLGGIASVMGSTLMSNDNFRGLAAMPFVPSVLSNPSPLTFQLLSVIRSAVFMAGVAMIMTPFIRLLRRSEKESADNGLVTFAMVTLGLRMPAPLSPKDKVALLEHLLNKQPCSTLDLISHFTTLSASEVNFENNFLYVLVGALLVKRAPLFARAFKLNMRWRSALLLNLDYSGDDSNLKKLSMLIKTLDGLSMFDSDRMISRLNNLASNKPINDNINNGENYLNYVELYLRDKNDLYAIIFKWRVLEIIHELNVTYLSVFAEDADKKAETISELKDDIRKIDDLLLGNEGLLVQYFMLFKCVLFPESTPELMKYMKCEIVNNLAKVSAIVDGANLTDDEEISDDESYASCGESDGTTALSLESASTTKDPIETLVNQKSLVYSLNLVNEEKFIVLTSSLIAYYSENKNNAKSLDLLRYLKFKTGKVPLSLLSFTCLVKLLCILVKPADEEEEKEEEETLTCLVDSSTSVVLESLVKLTRGWLNDHRKKNFMTNRLRGELSDLVMSKGMALNEI